MADGKPPSAKPAAGRKIAPAKAATPVKAPEPVKVQEPLKALPVKAETPAPKPAPVVAQPAPVAAKPAPAPAPKPVVAKAPVAAKVEAPKPEAPKPVKAEAPKPVAAKPAPAPAKPAKVVATPPAWLDPTPVTDLPKIETVAAVKTEPTKSPVKGARIMTDTIAQTKVSADQFQAAFGDFSNRAKDAFDKSSHVAEELADLTRGNIEALVASSKTAAKYVETLSQGAADYGRRSFEQASATFKSFSEVKTPNDLLKLQSDYARSAFDQWIAESAKVSETVIKLTNEVVEPLTSRYAVAAERVKTLAV